VPDAKAGDDRHKEIGLVEFGFQPDDFERSHVSALAGPISVWFRAWQQRIARRFVTRTDQ
jgi:hypothetical protein